MKLRNIPFIITYAVCLLLFLLGVLFYRQPLLSVLIILFIILPPISVYLTVLGTKSLEFGLTAPEGTINPGAYANFTLSVSNSSFIPLLNVCVSVKHENLYYPDSAPSEIILPAEIRSRKNFILPFVVSRPGMFSVSIEKIVITDFLHIYSKELKSDLAVMLPVIPEEGIFEDLYLPKATVEAEDSEPSAEGELTSDLKQLREYRPGDRLKDIHWKLSARTEDLMVKEYEASKDLYFLILPELELSTLEEGLNTLMRLSLTLLRAKESFRLALYHSSEGIFEFLKISTQSDLDIAFYKLYLEPVGEHSDIYDRFTAMFPDMYGVVRICAGKLYTAGVDSL